MPRRSPGILARMSRRQRKHWLQRRRKSKIESGSGSGICGGGFGGGDGGGGGGGGGGASVAAKTSGQARPLRPNNWDNMSKNHKKKWRNTEGNHAERKVKVAP